MGRLASATALGLIVCSLSAGLATGADDDAASGSDLPRVTLEEVSISGPEDVARLERLGLDVTHDIKEDSATVALYSDAERALLDSRGFSSRTLIGDLAEKNSAERLAESSVAVPTALPSGRSTYRVYDDYLAEIDQLAEQNPDFVRKVVIGKSLEGRDIVGLEIASEVNREDDGRPVYVQMGLHHVREWPSGEFPMEFAIDLVEHYNAGDDPDVTGLVENARTFILPVINPDGFLVSRGAALSPIGGGGAAGVGIVAGSGEYKRKNCRPADAAQAALPCAQRPATSGVDLNRNYGYYWGGPGSSTTASSESFRGAAPFSEPESEAVHRFVSAIHPTVLITNHTFTENGWWLRQPGFNGSFFPQDAQGATTPDETEMKALGDAMGDEGMDNPLLGATGWPSDRSWELGDITGATEDWNYFAQGTYGYTPEARGSDFHGLYQAMVVTEYSGDPAHDGEGVREAFLLAGDEAYDTDNHGVLQGTVPPGATLTLHKEFDAPRHPQNGGPPTHEVLNTTLEGPADGTYEWHVMPSDRPEIPNSPLPPGDEQWTMTCQQPGQGTFTKSVDVTRGQQLIVNWSGGNCGTEPVTNQPPVADFDFSPDAPEVGEQVTFVSTSTDPDGAIDPGQTKWDLDNDSEFDDATGLTATRTFDSPGSFQVAVQVTDDDNVWARKTKTIQVSPAANQPPTADFTIFPSSPGVGDDVTFTSTSTDPDGTVVSHEWDLDVDGDFDDAQGSQVTRAFTVAGTYEISLRATDDDGATGLRSRTLTVGATQAAPAPFPQPSTQAPAASSIDHCQRLRQRLKKAKSKPRRRKIRRNMSKRGCIRSAARPKPKRK